MIITLKYQRGQYLINSPQSEYLFELQQGSAIAENIRKDGTERTHKIYTPPDLIGIQTLLEQTEYAPIRARENIICKAQPISEIKPDNDLVATILKQITDEQKEQYQLQTWRDLPNRTETLQKIIEHYQQKGITFHSHYELSTLTYMCRETVSRLLKHTKHPKKAFIYGKRRKNI